MKLSNPQRIAPLSYFAEPNTEREVLLHGPHVFDLDGDGSDEIIVSGIESQASTPSTFTNTTVKIFSWRDGKLVDVTKSWLPNGMDQIEGSADIVFGDFNGDGRTDMLLPGSADMKWPANTYVFYNQGSSFVRSDLGVDYWMHGADSADINKDGYMDVMSVGYDQSKIFLGGANGMTSVAIPFWGKGSGVALGDFLGNGKVQAAIIDNATADVAADSRLYTITSDYRLQLIGVLPTPILATEKFRYLNVSSHDVSALPWDFNRDGKLDILVMSRGWGTGTGGDRWVAISQVQFLENRGNGQFVDVTEQRLVGYDMNTFVSYEPMLGDFDGDGDEDIFLSHSGNIPSTRILINNNGVFTDTGLKMFAPTLSGYNSIGAIARDDQGNWNYLVDNFYHVGNQTISTMTSYRLVFDNAKSVNDVGFKVSSVWKFGHAYNAGSPERAGDGETIKLEGKNRSTEVYQGTKNYDRLLGTDGDDALFLDDLISPFADKKSQSRLVDIEEINMGAGNDFVDLTSKKYSIGDMIIYGGAGDDTIWSSKGNDLLSGGPGRDIFWGGASDDTFLFTSLDARDTIKDFRSGEDRIAFDASVFTRLDNSLFDNFATGSKVQDGNDYLVYRDGILYYDPDGSGPGEMIEIVELIGAPVLDPDDFFLM